MEVPLKISEGTPLCDRVLSTIKKRISLQFQNSFPSDTEEVLAEYVKVMLCNGKSKEQCTAELKPFVKDAAVPFIEWLWNFLNLLKASHPEEIPQIRINTEGNIRLDQRPTVQQPSICNKPSLIVVEDASDDGDGDVQCTGEGLMSLKSLSKKTTSQGLAPPSSFSKATGSVNTSASLHSAYPSRVTPSKTNTGMLVHYNEEMLLLHGNFNPNLVQPQFTMSQPQPQPQRSPHPQRSPQPQPQPQLQPQRSPQSQRQPLLQPQLQLQLQPQTHLQFSRMAGQTIQETLPHAPPSPPPQRRVVSLNAEQIAPPSVQVMPSFRLSVSNSGMPSLPRSNNTFPLNPSGTLIAAAQTPASFSVIFDDTNRIISSKDNRVLNTVMLQQQQQQQQLLPSGDGGMSDLPMEVISTVPSAGFASFQRTISNPPVSATSTPLAPSTSLFQGTTGTTSSSQNVDSSRLPKRSTEALGPSFKVETSRSWNTMPSTVETHGRGSASVEIASSSPPENSNRKCVMEKRPRPLIRPDNLPTSTSRADSHDGAFRDQRQHPPRTEQRGNPSPTSPKRSRAATELPLRRPPLRATLRRPPLLTMAGAGAAAAAGRVSSTSQRSQQRQHRQQPPTPSPPSAARRAVLEVKRPFQQIGLKRERNVALTPPSSFLTEQRRDGGGATASSRLLLASGRRQNEATIYPPRRTHRVDRADSGGIERVIKRRHIEFSRR